MQTNNEASMSAAEIKNEVLLGSHARVKAFLAPLIAQTQSVVGDKFTVSYNGTGKILVEIEANPLPTATTWKMIWAAAKTARGVLPKTVKVSKPERHVVNGGTFQIVRDSFLVSVR